MIITITNLTKPTTQFTPLALNVEQKKRQMKDKIIKLILYLKEN